MEQAYGIGDNEKRVLRYLYNHSGIDTRYSVIPDYTAPMDQWQFFAKRADLEPFPTIDTRMQWFEEYAWRLSMQAIEKCIDGYADAKDITHLITVSCTGMSAPGLELALMDAMEMNPAVHRSGINFMGCYAAIHALKQANDIVRSQPGSVVLIVCTELCTLHFQKTYTEDTITAPLLFGDGCAAVLVTDDDNSHTGLHIDSFYAEVLKDAKNSMTWKISANGYIMRLLGDVPEIFKRDIRPLKERAFAKAGLTTEEVKYWCIHPGGKRILQGIAGGLALDENDLISSYKILQQYGNMSSPTVLFVLKDMWDRMLADKDAAVFCAAFGPGLTMESMIMSVA